MRIDGNMSGNEKVEDVDLYLLLEVSPEATKEEIKKAYRKKAVKCHPDKNPGNPKATQEFQALLNAYTILYDDNTRRDYDSKCKNKRELSEEDQRKMADILKPRRREGEERRQWERDAVRLWMRFTPQQQWQIIIGLLIEAMENSYYYDSDSD